MDSVAKHLIISLIILLRGECSISFNTFIFKRSDSKLKILEICLSETKFSKPSKNSNKVNFSFWFPSSMIVLIIWIDFYFRYSCLSKDVAEATFSDKMLESK
ncbi:MAG: hypothetical protein CM15mP4_2930 [Candidatus Neomarinimicrobiota bacterium]|nr:MAG: hypothetical protein CM15mP4_2930 [Candidatus Neomarinimicrobiota bacterium]